MEDKYIFGWKMDLEIELFENCNGDDEEVVGDNGVPRKLTSDDEEVSEIEDDHDFCDYKSNNNLSKG